MYGDASKVLPTKNQGDFSLRNFRFRIERDDTYIANLSAEVMAFCDELETIVNRYREAP